jgi:hypothetical protein
MLGQTEAKAGRASAERYLPSSEKQQNFLAWVISVIF